MRILLARDERSALSTAVANHGQKPRASNAGADRGFAEKIGRMLRLKRRGGCDGE